jgi:uncharacterized protein (DUF302 family)
MGIIKNIFALIGFLLIASIVTAVILYSDDISKIRYFDKQAAATYMEMGKKLLETGNAAEATVWKVPVKEGLTPDEVEQSMRSIASSHNIKNVGELPLSKQVEAMSGKPYRYLKIFMFCNALTAANMIDFSDAYSAYLPCRITLLEDSEGKLWLYSLNMDLMIHGGTPLPPALKEEAMHVKEIITDIMNRGAVGDF